MQDDQTRGISVDVAQLGARRHYAVPAALHRHGILGTFYTDLYAGRAASRVLAAVPGRAGKRMASRRCEEIPDSQVVSFRSFGLRYHRQNARVATMSECVNNWLWGGRRFCELILQRGLHSDAVYGFSSASLELLQAARTEGRKGLLDLATAPLSYERRLLEEECSRFPGWTHDDPGIGSTEDYDMRQRDEWQTADAILCGSSYMKRVFGEEGGPVDRALVVPLGHQAVAGTTVQSSDANRPLRLLFVGNGGLLKGLGYLDEAIQNLNSRQIECRIVGNLSLSEKALTTLGRRAELLGGMPRTAVAEQYAWADVFVLPSVSETFGLVLLEAMAVGLPVIATENSAGPDLIDDGKEGFVVPTRDPDALAQRIDQLATSQAVLREMGHAAREKAAANDLNAYGERLAAAVRKACSSNE